MVNVDIILTIFLIELVVDFIVLKIFKIHYRFIYLLFLQIPKICTSVICELYSSIVWVCILSKILSKLICVIFITDSFKIKRLFLLMMQEIVILFSVWGATEFLALCLKVSIENILNKKMPPNLKFLLVFGIFLYIFAVFTLVRNLDKNKKIKKHLAKVSFCVNQKHIFLYGLIDSGNSLLDPITRKPVVLVSLDSLKKFFAESEINDLLNLKCRKIKCDTISGSGFEIPVFEAKNFVIKNNDETERFLCMVGVVNQKFEKGKFDCLLHRDFL